MRWWWAFFLLHQNTLFLVPSYLSSFQSVHFEEKKYLNHKFEPSGWYEKISTEFETKIEKFYVAKEGDVILRALIKWGYGWKELKANLSRQQIYALNNSIKDSYQPIKIKYGVKTVWSGWIKQIMFWIDVNDRTEEIGAGAAWGNFTSWTALGGVGIDVKLTLNNWLANKWEDVKKVLDNKDYHNIYTGDTISGNNDDNKKRVLNKINTLVEHNVINHLKRTNFYENYVELVFQETIDNYEINKKMRFNFKYLLAPEYQDLQKKLDNLNNQLTIATSENTLKSNQKKIKTVINERLGSLSWKGYALRNNITNYHFIPARDNYSKESVDVYFKITLATDAIHIKKRFEIKLILDKEYYLKDINNRISYQTKGTFKDITYDNKPFLACDDDVYIKFSTGKEEKEILMINNINIGVTDYNFNYILLDNRFDKESDVDGLGNNIYNIKVMTKPNNAEQWNNQKITYEKNIIIIKGIPKFDVNLWADNDDQNINQINKTIIYNPIINSNFLWDPKWLRDKEGYLLQNINGLSVSLLAFKKPTIIEKQLVKANDIDLQFKSRSFDNLKDIKIIFFDENYEKNQVFSNLENTNEYYSQTGIYRIIFKNIIDKYSTYYHINLGKRIKNNFNNEKIDPLNYLKDNLNYFWDSILGRGLINYLRGASWYINLKTNKVISWKDYQVKSKLEKLNYIRQATKHYDAKKLLTMRVETIHFHIMRLIKDLQYDTGGVLEQKIKEGDNGGQEELNDEITIKECKKDCRDQLEKDKKELKDKNKKEDLIRDKEWKDKEDKIIIATINDNSKKTKILLAIILIGGTGIVLLGIIIFYRRKKSLR